MSEEKIFPFRARLERGARGFQTSERTGWLTPYEVETLLEDALWAGEGAQLDVAVPGATKEEGIDWVRERFARLRRRGIDARVVRDESWHYKDLVKTQAS